MNGSRFSPVRLSARLFVVALGLGLSVGCAGAGHSSDGSADGVTTARDTLEEGRRSYVIHHRPSVPAETLAQRYGLVIDSMWSREAGYFAARLTVDAVDHLRGDTLVRDVLIPLGDDVIRGPIYGVDSTGRIVDSVPKSDSAPPDDPPRER